MFRLNGSLGVATKEPKLVISSTNSKCFHVMVVVELDLLGSTIGSDTSIAINQ